MSPDDRATRLRGILNDEAFQDAMQEVEADALHHLAGCAESEVVAARAKYLAVTTLKQTLEALVNRPAFTEARGERRNPLA